MLVISVFSNVVLFEAFVAEIAAGVVFVVVGVFEVPFALVVGNCLIVVFEVAVVLSLSLYM